MDYVRSVLALLTIPVDMHPPALHTANAAAGASPPTRLARPETASSEVSYVARAPCRRACQRRLRVTRSPAVGRVSQRSAMVPRLMGAPLLPSVSRPHMSPRTVLLEVLHASVAQSGRSVGWVRRCVGSSASSEACREYLAWLTERTAAACSLASAGRGHTCTTTPCMHSCYMSR